MLTQLVHFQLGQPLIHGRVVEQSRSTPPKVVLWIRRSRVSPREAHRRIVEYFRQQCDGAWVRLTGHPYAAQHLAYHREQVLHQGTAPLHSARLNR
jgi:hypothetical protein